jgi:hypothetical protein
MAKFALVTFNDIPSNETTLKYHVLGQMSQLSHQLYCARHNYAFINQVEIDRSRPACWSKLLAIHNALQEHEWVLWADSDTLISNASLRLEELCDSRYDLIVQYQEFWWKLVGIKDGTRHSPINSGVFLIKSSPWSSHFLQESYAQTQYVTHGEVWDGIGDQEAMNHCIRTHPKYRDRIKYVEWLQISPKLFQENYLLVHFYGNHGQHHIPSHECETVFERWATAIENKDPLPQDKARFHWCCIQSTNQYPATATVGLDHFMYTTKDISLIGTVP